MNIPLLHKLTPALLPLALTLHSCSHTDNSRINEADVSGAWMFRIHDEGFSGNDTIRLYRNLTFSESRSVSYSGSDSGFDFSVPFLVNIKGIWHIKNDSLWVHYDYSTLTISIPEHKIRISATGNKADNQKLNVLAADMKKDLCLHVRGFVQSGYASISADKVSLGRITDLQPYSMSISNGKIKTILKRMPQ